MWLWWSRESFLCLSENNSKIEGIDSSLSLGQTAAGAERGSWSTEVFGMLSCVVCPEAVKINCPGDKLPGDSGTDAVAPLRAQQELGPGVRRSPYQWVSPVGGFQESLTLWKGSRPLAVQRVSRRSGPQRTRWVEGLQPKEFQLADREDVAGSTTGWWGSDPISLFSFLLFFLRPFLFLLRILGLDFRSKVASCREYFSFKMFLNW